MHLTKKDIDHLAKLAKLKLSGKDTEKFVWTMDEIIRFLGKLDEIETSNLPAGEGENEMQCFETMEKFEDSDLLLKNSRHSNWEYLTVQTALK